MGKNIDKRTWGVLGKMKTYYSPQKQVEGKTKTPLNANAFDSWDVKRSRFKRIDGYENKVPPHIQQMDGINESSVSITPTPTPTITSTCTSTPTVTPTNTSTPTPSITPSSTPIIDCYWDTNNDNWENDSTLWNDCINVPTPTPSPTNTSTPTITPTKTTTPTITPTKTTTPTTTSTNTPTPSITPSPTFVSGTTEAKTYLEAVVVGGGTGLTSGISAATITLFTSLVSNNLWDKLDIFYPMLGGNSGGMKVNGKNPGTNDLTFNGGWTFSSSGATGNGTNAFAETSYPDTNTSLNDYHMGIYSFVAVSNTNIDCGVGSASANTRSAMYVNEATTFGASAHRANSGYITSAWTGNDGRGLYVVDRPASNSEKSFRNGSFATSATTASTSKTSNTYVFGARRIDNQITEAYSNRGYNWFSIGKSMSDAQQATFSTIINTFQTSLNRNSY